VSSSSPSWVPRFASVQSEWDGIPSTDDTTVGGGGGVDLASADDDYDADDDSILMDASLRNAARTIEDGITVKKNDRPNIQVDTNFRQNGNPSIKTKISASVRESGYDSVKYYMVRSIFFFGNRPSLTAHKIQPKVRSL
jgi:hypothetical protein